MWLIRDFRTRQIFERRKRYISSLSGFFHINNNVDWLNKLYDDCGEMRPDLIRTLQNNGNNPIEFKPWWDE